MNATRRPTRATAEGEAVEAARKTALVVEDERLVRMLIVDALEECGY